MLCGQSTGKAGHFLVGFCWKQNVGLDWMSSRCSKVSLMSQCREMETDWSLEFPNLGELENAKCPYPMTHLQSPYNIDNLCHILVQIHFGVILLTMERKWFYFIFIFLNHHMKDADWMLRFELGECCIILYTSWSGLVRKAEELWHIIKKVHFPCTMMRFWINIFL